MTKSSDKNADPTWTPAMTKIPVCRVAGCTADQTVTYAHDKGRELEPIHPLNCGMCIAHRGSMPKEIRARIAVATTQAELDAAFTDARAIGWKAPDDRVPVGWFTLHNNRDVVGLSGT